MPHQPTLTTAPQGRDSIRLSDSDAADHEFSYQIQVGGREFMKGDALSMGVIFGNLQGRNFAVRRPGETGTYQQWLDYMRGQTNTALDRGTAIRLLDPDGAELESSSIGKGV